MCLQQSSDSTHGKMSVMAGLTEELAQFSTGEVVPIITGERLNPIGVGEELALNEDTVTRTYCINLL